MDAFRSPTAERLVAQARRRWSGSGDDRSQATPSSEGANETWRSDRFLRAGAFLLAGGVAAAVVWATIDRFRATIPASLVPQNKLNAVDGLPVFGQIFSTSHVFSWLPPVDGYDPFTSPGNAATSDVRQLVVLLLAGAVLIAALRAVRRDQISMLGAVTALVAVAAGPAFVVLTAIVSKVLIDAGGRYGLSILGVFVIVLAASVRGRVAVAAFAAFAALAYVTILVTVPNSERADAPCPLTAGAVVTMSDGLPSRSDGDMAYARRLVALERRWLARVFDVQRPYRHNIRRLEPGFVLDVGCGLGRNLRHLDGNGVGIDTDAAAVEIARSRGLAAFTPDDFAASEFARSGRFDSMIAAHVLEHLTPDDADELLRRYLPFVRAAGLVILICPQEAGFKSDHTHVTYFDGVALARLAARCGVTDTRVRSFPLPRVGGRLFRYNETILVGCAPHD